MLPVGGSWLDNEELFDVDAIRTVPITPYERTEDTRSTITNTVDIGSSSAAKRRKVNEISTSRNDGGRGKSRGKAPRVNLVDEVTDLEEVHGVEDETYPQLDAMDEDDDIDEEDLT